MNMKKTTAVTVRKHGYKARRMELLARPHLDSESGVSPRSFSGERLKTRLAFETNSQAYLWITDRGRSRLIKH